MIPYAKQTVSKEDINAVVEVLRSDWLTQGPVLPAFESALAQFCGAQGAVAVNSGTAALHIACLALGLSPGDGLWTSPISFVASANCGRYCGAKVDFVDIDPATANICPLALEKKLRQAAADDCLPKVLIVVHLGGNCCDMAAIAELAKHYNIRIIEDACHALGAAYNSYKVGSCHYSDIVVFSFHPVKIITAGEGGAALCNDTDVLKKMCALQQHGITRDAAEFTNSPGPAADWYYEQQQLGWNYRMTDIHAALGLSQLRRVGEFLARRKAVAERYRQGLESLPCNILALTPRSVCSYHLLIIQVDKAERALLFSHLRESGIGVQVHYIPIHTQPYYREMGFNWGDYPLAEQYYQQALSLPIFPTLSEREQDRAISALDVFWR